MNDLKEKTVIITGGSRGIGKACVTAFAREGAQVVFTYNKSSSDADALVKEIKKHTSSTVYAFQADVRDYQQCRGVVENTLQKCGRLDIIVNNAGIVRDKALMMMTQEDWKDVIDTNLTGTFNMTRSAITTLLKQKSGCIINMSSVSGLAGIPRQSNYSASKAGIIGFTRSLAKEVAAYNIRVNAVCPGFISTDMVYSLKDEIRQEIMKQIPMGRLGTVEEVADLCTFIASSKAAYMTGEVIKIDGGLAV